MQKRNHSRNEAVLILTACFYETKGKLKFVHLYFWLPGLDYLSAQSILPTSRPLFSLVQPYCFKLILK